MSKQTKQALNAYVLVDAELQKIRLKALSEGNFALYDETQARIKANLDAMNQQKEINSKLDKSSKGQLWIKVVTILGGGGLLAFMAKTEKVDGNMFTGANQHWLKAIISWFTGNK